MGCYCSNSWTHATRKRNWSPETAATCARSCCHRGHTPAARWTSHTPRTGPGTSSRTLAAHGGLPLRRRTAAHSPPAAWRPSSGRRHCMWTKKRGKGREQQNTIRRLGKQANIKLTTGTTTHTEVQLLLPLLLTL